MSDWKDNVSFVLVDTLEPGNIGASARALKNLGFSRLDLVRPRKHPSDEAGWFAHGAEDVLAAARIHKDLWPPLRDVSVVIGTTRRRGRRRGRVYQIREAAERIRYYAGNNPVAILFGKEDRGLTNAETAECAFMVTIPANPSNPSFNLAQAVLIVAYELSCTGDDKTTPPVIISNEELGTLFLRLQKVMKLAGYEPKGIRDCEHDIMVNLRRLLARTGLTRREARMLHGIISQVEGKLAERTRTSRS